MTHIAPASVLLPKPISMLERSLNFGGGASTGQLYSTYVLSGTIADAASVGLYDSGTCALLIGEQRSLVGNTKTAAARLSRLKSLPAGERRFLQGVEAACEGVTALLDAVQALSLTPRNALAQAEYGRVRATTLEAVRGLLGGSPL